MGAFVIAVVLQREGEVNLAQRVSLHDAGVPAAHIPAAPALTGHVFGLCAETHPQ